VVWTVEWGVVVVLWVVQDHMTVHPWVVTSMALLGNHR